MIAQCHAKRNKEQGNRGGRYSSNVTEPKEEEPETFEEMMESLSIGYEPAHMTARLIIGGKAAKVLLDTGTVGTNLM